MEDRWLSVEEIGEYLGVGCDTIYKLIENKGLHDRRIVRLWKFKKDAVDDWIKTNDSRVQGSEVHGSMTNDC